MHQSYENIFCHIYFPILYIYVKSLWKGISHDRALLRAETRHVLVSRMKVDYRLKIVRTSIALLRTTDLISKYLFVC